eukprot:Hpha_TRINITY_DN12537_c0_g1::TRINITY_DN12537_c0_g1_i1::g.51157::m.51157
MASRGCARFGPASLIALLLSCAAPAAAEVKGHSAMIFGGSGTVGGSVLAELGRSTEWKHIYVVGRRALPAGVVPARATQIVVPDLFALEAAPELKALGSVDVCFIATGLGDYTGASLATLHKVEVEMVGVIARACKGRGARVVSLLSAVTAHEAPVPLTKEDHAGASEIVGFWSVILPWYDRVMGLKERAVAEAGSPMVRVFRPSTIVTDQTRYGWVDGFLFPLHRVLDPWMGSSPYRSIPARDLGAAFVRDAEGVLAASPPKEQIVEPLYWQNFTTLAGEGASAPTANSEL